MVQSVEEQRRQAWRREKRGANENERTEERKSAERISQCGRDLAVVRYQEGLPRVRGGQELEALSLICSALKE